MKSGILPGKSPSANGQEKQDEGATLTFNAQGHFECRWVTLKPVSQTCIWTKGLNELIECPVAHGEGNFQTSEIFPLSSFIVNLTKSRLPMFVPMVPLQKANILSTPMAQSLILPGFATHKEMSLA